MSLKFSDLEEEYSELWASMEIRDTFKAALNTSAQTIIAGKARYSAVSDSTGVPWYVVGLIHQMEAGCNFSCHLHNGDSLKARTRNVPANRPLTGQAPYIWEVSACDALTMHAFDRVTDWSIARIAYELERYNGLGYRHNHRATLSPYLWSGTTHYARGKYVSDGRWDASAVSAQTGAMAILSTLFAIDPSLAINAKPVETVPLIPQATVAESFTKANAAPPVSKVTVSAVSATVAAAAAPIAQSMPPAVPESITKTIEQVHAWTTVGDEWLTIKTWATTQPLLAGSLSIGVGVFYLWSKHQERARR